MHASETPAQLGLGVRPLWGEGGEALGHVEAETTELGARCSPGASTLGWHLLVWMKIKIRPCGVWNSLPGLLPLPTGPGPESAHSKLQPDPQALMSWRGRCPLSSPRMKPHAHPADGLATSGVYSCPLCSEREGTWQRDTEARP